MTTTTKYKWEKIWDCGSFEDGKFYGHKVFRRKYINGPLHLAICDMSGDTPEQSEDGVLWLDDSRPFELLGTKPFMVSIPVMREDGTETRTFCPPNGIPVLFAWIKCNLRSFDIKLETNKEVFDHLEVMTQMKAWLTCT